MIIRQFGHSSHVGKVRVHNEDNYVVDAENGFCVLADGMGGHESGEVASQIVVDVVIAELLAGRQLAEALITAHYEVVEAARNGKGGQGMGSTAIAFKINHKEFEIAWVGDSRVYLWDGGKLSQLTKDHSLVQAMVDDGTITAEEALVHPDRNYVTQAIGMMKLSEMHVGRIQGKVRPEYVFLLCSDGLTTEVSHEEISGVMELELSEQEKTDLLIQKALDNGGSDNVTIVVVHAPEVA